MSEKKPKKLKANGEPYTTAGPPHYSGPGGWKPTPEKPVKNPKIIIDPAEVERLAYLNVPTSVMAKFLGIERHYLVARIESDPVLKKARDKGEARIRIDLAEQQINRALDPKSYAQATMLIWLGKNIMGQVDKPEGEQTAPTRIEFVFPEAPVAEANPTTEPKKGDPADETE